MTQSTLHRFSWRSLGLWVALTLLGYLLAAELHFQADGPTATFHLRDFKFDLLGLLLGALSGLIIGSLQWLVLKSWIPNSRLWILLNVIGFGLIHFLNDSIPYRPFALPVHFVIHGLIIGLTQYIALRHALAKALLWIPLAAGIWFLGFQLGFTLLAAVGISGNPLAERAILLGIAGLTTGVLTGLALKFLVVQDQPMPENSPNPVLLNRWSNASQAKKVLLACLAIIIMVAILAFAGMMLGVL
jgi:hypothetical protein